MEYLGWKGLNKDEESKDVEKKESRRSWVRDIWKIQLYAYYFIS